MSKFGFGFGLAVGSALGVVAGMALAGDAGQRDRLRQRSIVLKQRADTELARLRSRADEWREPVQRAVTESVQAARRTRETLGQRLGRPTGSAPPASTEPLQD